MSNSSLNLRWTSALVEGLKYAGVKQAVLSPGSRCTPITLACDAHLQTTVIVDERSAAFYAIGLAKATSLPVVLVCTSGTAAANWYPAVVEASYGRVPLILLTADRPPELQGLGANQAIDQVKLFGNFVRAYHGLPPAAYRVLAAIDTLTARAVEQSLWPLPGPVHINIPLREPLFSKQKLAQVTPKLKSIAQFIRPILHPDPTILSSLVPQLTSSSGCIICGELPYDPQLAAAITTLAATLDCPIFADPLANLRCGTHDHRHILCHYDSWLLNPTSTTFVPQWLLHFGTMPTSKRLQRALISINPPLYIAVDAQGNWIAPQHAVTMMIRADPAAFCTDLVNLIIKSPLSCQVERAGGGVAVPSPLSCQGEGGQGGGVAVDGVNSWHSILEPLDSHAHAKLINTVIPFEWELIQEIVAALPPQSTLFIGNSMPIRDLDACLGADTKPLRIVANRGASGIDGTVSTLAGLAAGSQTTVVGVVGDLALFHDLNGLQTLIDLNVILIVINNGGGGIFRYLSESSLPRFTENWLTPTKLNIAQAATLFGLRYQRATCRYTFATALQEALVKKGAWLVEAVVDAEISVAQHKAYWNAVAEM